MLMAEWYVVTLGHVSLTKFLEFMSRESKIIQCYPHMELQLILVSHLVFEILHFKEFNRLFVTFQAG